MLAYWFCKNDIKYAVIIKIQNIWTIQNGLLANTERFIGLYKTVYWLIQYSKYMYLRPK